MRITKAHLPMDLPTPGMEGYRPANPWHATTPAFTNDQSMICQDAKTKCSHLPTQERAPPKACGGLLPNSTDCCSSTWRYCCRLLLALGNTLKYPNIFSFFLFRSDLLLRVPETSAGKISRACTGYARRAL
ncbi:unnamed protein product [Ectocarpus sp. 4 AP-2014]